MSDPQATDFDKLAKVLEILAQGFQIIASKSITANQLFRQQQIAVEMVKRCGLPRFQHFDCDDETVWNNEAVRDLWIEFLETAKVRFPAEQPPHSSFDSDDLRVAATKQADACRWLGSLLKRTE